MEKSLYKFNQCIEPINKDFTIYNDDKGNMFTFNTVNALVRVDYLELSKEEFEMAKFQLKVEDLDYNIINIKKAVPKNEITGKDEDKMTITEKEVAVRQIWNVSNPFGAYESFTNKEEALETATKINQDIMKYLK